MVDNIGTTMNPLLHPLALPAPLRLAAAVALLAAAPLAVAQYKVVDPAGKVTYTDRSPSASAGQVTSLSGRNVR